MPNDEAAFPDKTTVAYASLLQPILKSELLAHVGDLRPDTLGALQAVVLRNAGLIGQSTVAIPAEATAGPRLSSVPAPDPGASTTAADASSTSEKPKK